MKPNFPSFILLFIGFGNASVIDLCSSEAGIDDSGCYWTVHPLIRRLNFGPTMQIRGKTLFCGRWYMEHVE